MSYAMPNNAAPAGAVRLHESREGSAHVGQQAAFSTAEYRGDDAEATEAAADGAPMCLGQNRKGQPCKAYATKTGYCPGHEGQRLRFMAEGPS